MAIDLTRIDPAAGSSRVVIPRSQSLKLCVLEDDDPSQQKPFWGYFSPIANRVIQLGDPIDCLTFRVFKGVQDEGDRYVTVYNEETLRKLKAEVVTFSHYVDQHPPGLVRAIHSAPYIPLHLQVGHFNIKVKNGPATRYVTVKVCPVSLRFWLLAPDTGKLFYTDLEDFVQDSPDVYDSSGIEHFTLTAYDKQGLGELEKIAFPALGRKVITKDFMQKIKVDLPASLMQSLWESLPIIHSVLLPPAIEKEYRETSASGLDNFLPHLLLPQLFAREGFTSDLSLKVKQPTRVEELLVHHHSTGQISQMPVSEIAALGPLVSPSAFTGDTFTLAERLNPQDRRTYIQQFMDTVQRRNKQASYILPGRAYQDFLDKLDQI